MLRRATKLPEPQWHLAQLFVSAATSPQLVPPEQGQVPCDMSVIRRQKKTIKELRTRRQGGGDPRRAFSVLEDTCTPYSGICSLIGRYRGSMPLHMPLPRLYGRTVHLPYVCQSRD